MIFLQNLISSNSFWHWRQYLSQDYFLLLCWWKIDLIDFSKFAIHLIFFQAIDLKAMYLRFKQPLSKNI